MTDQFDPFWTLDDYQRTLDHPDSLLRHWAADRIQEQFPAQAPDLLLPLLTDDDPTIVLSVARLFKARGEPRHEDALLAAHAATEPYRVRLALGEALARLRADPLLPDLIAEVDAITPPAPREFAREGDSSLVGMLGEYPDEAARAALWRLARRYTTDDWLAATLFQALLRHADPQTVPQLLKIAEFLQPFERSTFLIASDLWGVMVNGFAEEAGLSLIAHDATRGFEQEGARGAWDAIEYWLDQPVPLSAEMEAALDRSYEAPEEAFQQLMPLIVSERARHSIARGDDLGPWYLAWTQGERPTGYRWRTLYAYQLLSTLAGMQLEEWAQIFSALGTALTVLAQAILDQNDEAALAAAPDDEARRARLLDIITSKRPNVLPGVEAEVAALGPSAVPPLVAALHDETSDAAWAMPRVVRALTRIAWAHPGALDEVIPAMLDLIHTNQAEEGLEEMHELLVAIGPAVISEVSERLRHNPDPTFEIYAVGVLREIPVRPALETLLQRAERDDYDEWDVEAFKGLGHVDALPLLQRDYEEDESLIGTALYVIATLNGYEGPELDEWREAAEAQEAKFREWLSEEPEELVTRLVQSVPAPPPEETPTEGTRRGKGKSKRKSKRRKKR